MISKIEEEKEGKEISVEISLGGVVGEELSK